MDSVELHVFKVDVFKNAGCAGSFTMTGCYPPPPPPLLPLQLCTAVCDEVTEADDDSIGLCPHHAGRTGKPVISFQATMMADHGYVYVVERDLTFLRTMQSFLLNVYGWCFYCGSFLLYVYSHGAWADERHCVCQYLAYWHS